MGLDKRASLIFFAPDMAGGGAEKMLAEFVNRIDRARFDVSVVLCAQRGAHLSLLSPGTVIHSLGKRGWWSFPLLVRRYHRLVARLQPDIVISFLWYADAIQLLGNPAGVASVCSVHTVPSGIRAERFGRLKVWLLRRLYRRANAVFVVSRYVAKEFVREYLGSDHPLMRVQPNPFSIKELVAKAAIGESPWRRGQTCRIVAVGRLAWEKGFDRLLRALSLLPADFAWELALVGEGEMRAVLEQQAHDLGLTGQVNFCGYLPNPYPVIASADTLVLSSRFEAYPSVILEAFALGTPVVAVDCPTGPAEILGPGRGVLVASDDGQAMADSIVSLISDLAQQARFIAAGREFIKQLDADSVTKQLEENLLNVLGRE